MQGGFLEKLDPVMDDEGDPFPQLGSVYKKGSCSYVNQLSKNVASMNPNSAQDGKVAAKAWPAQNSASSAWGCSNLVQKLGVQSNALTTQNTTFKKSPGNANELPLQQNNYPKHRQNLSQVGSACSSGREESRAKDESVSNHQLSGTGNDDVDGYAVFSSDDDDDFLFDSDFDLDASENSYDVLKKSKWFNAFFDDFDKLTVEEINSGARKWHCPACKGGPGAIDWYRGIDPLAYHAKTKKTRRVKLHRMFSEILDEEMHKKGGLVTPVGEAFGRWQGLDARVKDYEITWPPMVLIMNTRDEQEENGKQWIGMGNQELLDHFNSYAALKARHSYGPQGHRGISVLIFESSAAGYLEASRLHKHFIDQGRGRDAWDGNRVSFCTGGKRQLYGYMALKEDLDIFNQHCQGKNKLKFETVSYQEMVGSRIKQINEDSQMLVTYKNRFAAEHMQSQALAESLCRLSEKLKKTVQENRIVRERTKLLHEQTKEEMDSQEKFFKDQIKAIHQAIDAKEENFEKLQLAKLEKVKELNADPSKEENVDRVKDINRFIKIQDKEMEEFEAERKKLIRRHGDEKAALMKIYWEELLVLEKEFEDELTLLIDKHTPNQDHP
ncbi:PREDICTED: protein SUPPRESSOR OF GENE SILENCING 3-like isoform X3 [Populus euphratica]|uniref:Protein SUPPRESSOR OF GENE SILENCING 3-like isoform X3 n=1 Tax=Populus euphratica TaxID=75702 RepID=A0AAJ6X793_POPEU|nr:PREDICTED: protein SUPPRESSOR OF GENE SILENCING 3-like isoform X3 [Populus euphratica]